MHEDTRACVKNINDAWDFKEEGKPQVPSNTQSPYKI